ncbi:MAG: heme A synthase [Acidimicrobiales bacterium]|nr:heme A synthase [Acidimicrobiales bacterium]
MKNKLVANATALMISTYLLIVLGSTVRVTDSGTGCPGWPLCYGQLGPVDRPHALIEQSHRYLATVVTIFAFTTLWQAAKLGKKHLIFKLSAISLAVVLFQVVLGAVTVFTKNAPWTVAAHLLTAMAFLGIVSATWIVSIHKEATLIHLPSTVKVWAHLSLFFTFIMMFSGSLIVNGGAEKACYWWPICESGPPFHLLILHYIHRSIGVLAGASLIGMAVSTWRRYGNSDWWNKYAFGVFAAITLAATAGALSAITKAEEALADTHLALAALTWLMVVVFYTRLHLLVAGETEPDKPLVT